MRGIIQRGGQVWVETVIYTLIGLAIIGLVLTIARPKIEEKKDSIIIEQALEALKNIDSKIIEVKSAEGNRRSVELKVGKGYLLVDSDQDKLSWVIDSSFEYSEPDKTVSIGKVNVLTTKDPLEVTLWLNYDVDLTYSGENSGVKRINTASNPYTILIENRGRNDEEKLVIDMSPA